ncbi:MAG TPA: hypothetical protein VMV23_09560 [Candidatus Nanopelagicaceae bacterium]|nr:hypothetical protein [Candidatus Nanopelagicaceae bacterium]
MALWFLRGTRRGVVTTTYPKRADPSSAHLPTPPTFDSAALNASVATRMVAVCPSRALELEPGALILDRGRCTACQRCLTVGAGVGTPSGQFEWATREPARLRLSFPLAGGA